MAAPAVAARDPATRVRPADMRIGRTPGVRAALLASVIATLAGAGPARAHDSTDGSIVVAIDDRRVIVTAPVAFAELGFTDTSGDGRLDGTELAAQEGAVAASLVDTARVHAALTVDGEAIDIIAAGVPSLSETGSIDGVGGSPYVTLVLASGPHDGDVSDLELAWSFDSPLATVVLSNPDGAVTGRIGDAGTIAFSIGAWSSAVSFLSLGIEHIQFGPDHLLFLVVLTLAAAGATVSRSTAWRTVKLVTAFTLGHAISLALAYFEVISIPAAVVEPAISLSIVATALFAIRGGTADARLGLAGLIGLIHGLGFASNLDTLGVAASQRIAALAAFNLGIDLAQTVVVLIVIAGLWAIGRVRVEGISWVRTAGATGAAVIGLAWTASRLAELAI